jgi:hypothetical protein
MLLGYDPAKRAYVIGGFREGFRVGYNGSFSSFVSPNLSSAVSNPEMVKISLSKEVSLGRIVGPFLAPFFISG